MPVGSGPNNGSFPIVAANPVVFSGDGGIVLVDGVAQTSDELRSDNCPWANVWVRQIAGAGNVTVTVQFLDGRAAGNLAAWHPLVPPYGVALNVASLNNFRLGSSIYRLSIISNGAGATVQYRLTASPT